MSLYSEDIKKLNKREGIPFIVVLCSVVYLVSYLARLSFSAATVEMISAEGYSKTLIAIPLTALSVTYGKTSLVTGVINSATYVGSAVSTYGVALISDLFGWNGTIISWFIVSVAGALLSLLSVTLMNRLKRLNNKIK